MLTRIPSAKAKGQIRSRPSGQSAWTTKEPGRGFGASSKGETTEPDAASKEPSGVPSRVRIRTVHVVTGRSGDIDSGRAPRSGTPSSSSTPISGSGQRGTARRVRGPAIIYGAGRHPETASGFGRRERCRPVRSDAEIPGIPLPKP